MLDIGLLTLPTIAAIAALVSALFIGEEIVVERFRVSRQLEWAGYAPEVVTRQLTDGIRELSQAAQSELTALNVDEGSLEKGIAAFEDYFEIGQLINGARNTFGLIPYYINGEVTERRGQAVLRARVTIEEEERVKLIEVTGDVNDMQGLMHEAALQLLETINPYVVALYHRRAELDAGEFEFPQTRATIQKYLKERPFSEHFLAYGLLGRMHMLKAERDTSLTDAQREETYAEAIRTLHAALRQQPEFLFPIINLGLIYRHQEKYALAERHFARAVELNPNYLITRRAWAEMLRDQGKVRDALVQYVASAEIAPENAEIRYELAKLYMKLGYPEAAQRQFEEAIRLRPEEYEVTAMLELLDSDRSCSPLAAAAC